MRRSPGRYPEWVKGSALVTAAGFADTEACLSFGAFLRPHVRAGEGDGMLTKAKTWALVGLEGRIVDVEVDISAGLPAFTKAGTQSPGLVDT